MYKFTILLSIFYFVRRFKFKKRNNYVITLTLEYFININCYSIMHFNLLIHSITFYERVFSFIYFGRECNRFEFCITSCITFYLTSIEE